MLDYAVLTPAYVNTSVENGYEYLEENAHDNIYQNTGIVVGPKRPPIPPARRLSQVLIFIRVFDM